MTPKEKASDIYSKFRNENSPIMDNYRIKKQSIVCVQQILEEVGKWKNTYMGKDQFIYWELVKEEIDKIPN